MVDKPIPDTEQKAQPNDPKGLFEEARGAHRRGDLQKARLLYNKVIEQFHGEKEAIDTVEQAQAFNAILDRDFPSRRMGPVSTFLAIVVGCGVWFYFGLGIAAIFSKGARQLWLHHWGKMIIATIGVILILWISTWAEKKLAVKTEGTRRLIVAFIVVPLIALAMMAAIALGANRMAFAMEVVFILVASLLPAASYYLFLATRRPSILNEFIGNLSRLGLLLPRPSRRVVESGKAMNAERFDESREERRARIESYFQRFEAIYGMLRFETEGRTPLTRTGFVNNLIRSVDNRGSEFLMPQATVQVTDIFRANLLIPIGLVTILATLGWLLVMQPDLTSAIQAPGVKIEQARGEGKSLQSGPSLPLPADKEFSFQEEATLSPPKDAESTPGDQASESPGTKREESGDSTTGLIANLTPTWTPVSFAFLGAYFFGIQMLFRRFVRRDLGPNAYIAFSNRIIIAVIGIWVAVAAYAFLLNPADNGVRPNLYNLMIAPIDEPGEWPLDFLIIAFVIGVFPRMLWQFICAAFSKLLHIKAVIPTIEAKQPLNDLDGLTVWHESRLEEEDVENVPNMATVDVVEIMLHTQIPAERLISWIDQAILYSILGPKGTDRTGDSSREKLRAIGLRNATQVVAAFYGDEHQKGTLAAAIGEKEMHSFVLAIKLEGNYDRVSSWRRIDGLGETKNTSDFPTTISISQNKT